jgi:demethylmenaquinone methyltransferase/2-methoxy-6-polyprenyl-1,4-benzoquinol methylase
VDSRGMTSEEWLGVLEAMDSVEPYYDRVNGLITLGLADKWRREVAARAGPDDTVLELGSGPGSFARHLVSKRVFCVEPSRHLASVSRDSLPNERVTVIRGVGETIPLAEESVDKVFCSFSFRDFKDRSMGVSEMFRVLRPGGEVFITDVAKPPPGPMAKLLDMHVRHMVPVLARIAVGPEARARWARDPYRTFAETYSAFGFTTVYEGLLRDKGFGEVGTEFLRMKGATMTRGRKPWKSTSS